MIYSRKISTTEMNANHLRKSELFLIHRDHSNVCKKKNQPKFTRLGGD